MPRAVLDPNVLISGLISPLGAPGQLLKELRAGAFELVVSTDLLGELEEVLGRPKILERVDPDEASGFVRFITEESISRHGSPAAFAPQCQDPDDQYLVDLRQTSGADLLVSGDPHLLAMAREAPVVSPRQFLDLLTREP